MARILCIALNPTVDISSSARRVVPTRKIRTHDEMEFPGGGGVNVARVIAELGHRPELLYLSGGATGALLGDLLSALDIELKPLPIAGGVRLAYMVHEEETGLEYRFVPDGPEVTAAELAPVFDAVRAFDGDYIVASGSLPRGAAPGTYAQLAAIAGETGVRFVLDTSGEALKAALSASRLFLVKPSLGELETYAGRKLDAASAGDAALEIVRRGTARYVAVSLGGEGALLASAEGVIRRPARTVQAKSASGAGDSFTGAMIWALAEGRTAADAFRFGLAAGTAAVLTAGTQLCRREDVFAFYEEEKAEG